MSSMEFNVLPGFFVRPFTSRFAFTKPVTASVSASKIRTLGQLTTEPGEDPSDENWLVLWRSLTDSNVPTNVAPPALPTLHS